MCRLDMVVTMAQPSAVGCAVHHIAAREGFKRVQLLGLVEVQRYPAQEFVGLPMLNQPSTYMCKFEQPRGTGG
jgi:hypothetical protein